MNMFFEHDTTESTRRIRRTLHMIAAMFVGFGFIVLVPTAVSGNMLGALFGFILIIGSLAGTALFNLLMRVNSRLTVIEQQVSRLASGESGLGGAVSQRSIDHPHSDSFDNDHAPSVADRPVVPGADGAELAAATLDRQVFPRLVTSMDVAAANRRATDDRTWSVDYAEPTAYVDQRNLAEDDGLTVRNLMRSWVVARRNGDLMTCRSIYAALVDTADVSVVDLLNEQLEDVTSRTRNRLRDDFARQVRDRNYLAAIETGERLQQFFPESELATEFRKLRPHLEHCLKNPPTTPHSSRATV